MTTSQPQNPAQIFDGYFGPAMFRPWGEVLIDIATPQSGETVLDLACGPGTVARQIAEQGLDVGSLHGLDSSAPMLSVAREKSAAAGFDIDWTEGVCESLPYEDNTFDLVISQQGLQFFQDREKSAREIYRVLKPGGRLVANTWLGTDYHTLWGELFKGVSSRLDAPLEVVSLPFMLGDAEELKSYIESGGFEGVETTQHELTLRFPEPPKMIQLSIGGAAAAIPTFGAMSPEERASVAKELSESMHDKIGPYVKGDFVEIESATNVAVARK